ncbi:female-specific protein transformer-like [Trichechus manatus latirostris]|uniref:Female-specific protein transformer-like n=1 Tax=Trichechus manatus latirostris TaxID=127582 RepID=A0A2Y9G438_TRIMA|nr:female-specific protein transformer-like [Trichechus manatus latirostris]
MSSSLKKFGCEEKGENGTDLEGSEWHTREKTIREKLMESKKQEIQPGKEAKGSANATAAQQEEGITERLKEVTKEKLEDGRKQVGAPPRAQRHPRKNYNSQPAPGPRAGRGSRSGSRRALRAQALPQRPPELVVRVRVGVGPGMEAGGGWERAPAPPPSLPARLRSPERLLSVCAGGCRRVSFGYPFP